MASNSPVKTGIAARISEIWSDIAYAQLRVIELNRPNVRG